MQAFFVRSLGAGPWRRVGGHAHVSGTKEGCAKLRESKQLPELCPIVSPNLLRKESAMELALSSGVAL